MSKFVLVSRIFVACMCIAFAADMVFGIPRVFYVTLIILYVLFLLYGSFVLQGQVFVKADYRIQTDQRIVALTFDDGPDETRTPELLDVLSRHEVKAAFFCIGKAVERHPGIIQRIDAEGHLLGLHSYGHSYWYDFKPSAVVLADIRHNAEVIRRITGKDPRWFRPPYGVTNPSIARAVQLGDLQVIGWSVRSFDTIRRSAAAIVRSVLRSVKPGAVVLLHDSLDRTPQVADELIRALKQDAYRFERLDKMIGGKPYRT